jgi:hypothetical protein
MRPAANSFKLLLLTKLSYQSERECNTRTHIHSRTEDVDLQQIIHSFGSICVCMWCVYDVYVCVCVCVCVCLCVSVCIIHVCIHKATTHTHLKTDHTLILGPLKLHQPSLCVCVCVCVFEYIHINHTYLPRNAHVYQPSLRERESLCLCLSVNECVCVRVCV